MQNSIGELFIICEWKQKAITMVHFSFFIHGQSNGAEMSMLRRVMLKCRQALPGGAALIGQVLTGVDHLWTLRMCFYTNTHQSCHCFLLLYLSLHNQLCPSSVVRLHTLSWLEEYSFKYKSEENISFLLTPPPKKQCSLIGQWIF